MRICFEALIGEKRPLFVRNSLTKIRTPSVYLLGKVPEARQEAIMNDLIVYAGVGILLIGLPILFAKLNTTKH